MTINAPGGSSANGNIPEAVNDDITLTTFDVETLGFGDQPVTLYMDGVENTRFNAGDESVAQFEVSGAASAVGTHTVEMVQMDGDTPVIYQ